ncbi:acyl-CoA dehydrogenase [Amycolatopsis endophytica]
MIDAVIDYSSADEIVGVLRAQAEKTEQGARPTVESLAAVRENKALALRTPRELGGVWAGAETMATTLASLGRGCPSTAWVVGTCVTAKNIAAKCFPGSLASEVFADPDALFCGSGIPADASRVPEGVRVTGRWPNVSGCEDSAWAVLGLQVEGTLCFALVPVAELTIERTWRVAGMRGTGSHTLVADDLLIPAARVAATASFSLADLLLHALTVLGPIVGAARGALDAIVTMFGSGRKPFTTSYTRMGESPGARHWLAEAVHLVNRAETTMLAVARAADSVELSEADRSSLHMDLADAGRDCRSAVERMLDLHGMSGFQNTNALQRYWRDISVGSRHPHLNPYLAAERFGVTMAGEDLPA